MNKVAIKDISGLKGHCHALRQQIADSELAVKSSLSGFSVLEVIGSSGFGRAYKKADRLINGPSKRIAADAVTLLVERLFFNRSNFLKKLVLTASLRFGLRRIL